MLSRDRHALEGAGGNVGSFLTLSFAGRALGSVGPMLVAMHPCRIQRLTLLNGSSGGTSRESSHQSPRTWPVLRGLLRREAEEGYRQRRLTALDKHWRRDEELGMTGPSQDGELVADHQSSRLMSCLLGISVAALVIGLWMWSLRLLPVVGSGEGPSKPVAAPTAPRTATGNVAFNHPDVMFLGRRSQITLVVAAGERQAVAALGKSFEGAVDGAIKTAPIQAAPKMAAVLHGLDFRIEEPGPRVKVFVENKPLQWSWYVEPTRLGRSKRLRVELYAVGEAVGNYPPATKLLHEYDAEVDVEFHWLERMLLHARELQPLAVVLTGLGAIGTMLMVVWKLNQQLRAWRRGRKSKASANQAGSEVSVARPSDPLASSLVGHTQQPSS